MSKKDQPYDQDADDWGPHTCCNCDEVVKWNPNGYFSEGWYHVDSNTMFCAGKMTKAMPKGGGDAEDNLG